MNTVPPRDPRQPFVMPRNPNEIDREIDETRERLNRTLGEVESKLSPRGRLRAAVGSGQEFLHDLRHSAVHSLDLTAMIRLDHTHVLALFHRFKPDSSNARKQALAANLCLALEIHGQLEEEIFYPALAAGGERELGSYQK